MKTQDTHIIQKVFVEVETNSSAKANDIRVNANTFIETNVLSVVEEYIARIEPRLKDVVVQLDPIHIEVDGNPGMIARLELKSAIEKQLDAIFLPVIRSVESRSTTKVNGAKIAPVSAKNDDSKERDGEVQLLTPELRAEKSVLHFIATGKAPWWISKNENLRSLLEEDSLLEMIERNLKDSGGKNFIAQLIPLLRKEVVRKRIVRQFGNRVVTRLISAIQHELNIIGKTGASENKRLSESERKGVEQSFIRILEKVTAHERLILSETLLFYISTGKSLEALTEEVTKTFTTKSQQKTREEFIQVAEKLLPSGKQLNKESEEKKLTQNPSDETPDSQIVPNEGILSENAGLVILVPYLKPFLKNIQLLDEEGQLTDPVLAAHTLHFLATGIEEDFEFTMLLEAWLCGLPIDEPLPRSVALSDEIKQACHELLTAVLKHWTALKSTSIPLLRNEFLQRDGKLILNEVAPRIVVERTTIDVLLDKIPWGFSIIKLPWLENMVYVEW